MTQERIRILVDQSRDSEWSRALVNIGPDNVYQITDNRDYLDGSVLRNYDVLTVCGYSPLEYTDEETELVRKFVETGGRLLLASSTSRFESYAGRPASEIHANKLARIFGAEFLPLDKCKGETKLDEDILCGYPREDLRLVYHAALGELELEDIHLSNCGILKISEDAQVFLQHSETKEPIGACVKFGKGRVLLINDVFFSHANQRTCRAFIDWLGENRISSAEGDETIPDEIPVEEYIKEDGNIKIYYGELVKDRIDTCLKFAKKIHEEIISAFPKGAERKWEIEALTSCSHRADWWSSAIRAGMSMSDSMLAYALGAQMTNLMDIGNVERFIRYTGLGYDVIAKCFGIKAMRLLGFGTEADEMRDGLIKKFREKDPTGTEFDIANAYEYHPKTFFILNTLMEKHGQDFFVRLAKSLPDHSTSWRDMPSLPFSAVDVFIYYLSRALEADLYPWFREIGTTVHPLPLHPKESDEFKNGVRQYVRDMIRDKTAIAIDRSNAAWCLIKMDDREEEPSPPDLASEDKYERLVAAMRLSRTSDSRSVRVLTELASDDDDRTLAAIASLELVRKGITSAADRLVETARGQDYKFQLDAGYALHKIEHEEADELSFRGLKDENGDPVVKMKVEYDGHLRFFPTVAGYKVANIFSEVNGSFHGIQLPAGTHVNGMYVEWVNTDPRYRRKGLSRWAMQQTFEHKTTRRHSCAVLGTGTRNNAHAMYRSFGFVDVMYSESFSKELYEEKAKIVDGLVIRSYAPGDEVKMTALVKECRADLLVVNKVRAVRLRPDSNYVKIAERDGEMLGYMRVPKGRNKEEARLSEVCLKKTDDRLKIGSALLCALHNELTSHGFKRINMNQEFLMTQKFMRELFYKFGYSSKRTGGVDMFKIINLPMLLEELSPLLGKRLERSNYKDWCGRIGVAGNQHKATLIIENGESRAVEGISENVDILISAGDDTITRIVAGIVTPYEAYLQIEMTIEPMVNDRVTGLLETLFPHIPKDN